MSIFRHLKNMLSGRYGTISSARVLMVIFSLFSLVLTGLLFRHMFREQDPAKLAMWLGALPAITGLLVGLISGPYAINKGAGSLSDIINAIRK